MKKLTSILIYPLAIMIALLALTNSCKKDESSSKKDPVITWANPADIGFGTLLSATQLNAIADVPGTFVYTPAIGIQLNEGANQDLKVNFTPSDDSTYNMVSKKVKINVTASTGNGIIFNPNLTYGTMTDIDGNVYKTITIGAQTWMAENLRTTKYRNGEQIESGLWCYDYDETDKLIYGALYDWATVTDIRKIAPVGWHVPSDAEWAILFTFLGGGNIIGTKLKETGTTHWHGSNENSTNETGFTALPGGGQYNGHYDFIGEQGAWWSSSEESYLIAWHMYLSIIGGGVGMNQTSKSDGLSVRCLLGEEIAKIDPIITWENPEDISFGTLLSATQLNATADVSGTFDYVPEIGTELEKGGYWELKVDFTPTDATTYNTVSKTVMINVTETPIIFNPNLTYGTMTDIDGNVYKTIMIGTQTWMAENLRTTKYRNGDLLGTAGGDRYWWYNGDSVVYSTIIGALYEWWAVSDSRNLAPQGWHIATDEDWTTLTTYLGGESVAGGKMKETGTTHWLTPNAEATNESGFTALPAGDYEINHMSYGYGIASNFWSNILTKRRFISYEYAWCYSGDYYNANYGYSVRCVKD